MNNLANKLNYIEDARSILKNVKCFILDLDGTFYLSDRIFDGSIDFLKTLEANNIEFRFFTNNSSKNTQFYINKIKNMGYDLDENMMLISNQVIISYIKDKMPSKRIFILGNEYLKKDFKEADLNLVEDNAEVVVVGFDTSLKYDNLSKACRFIRNGAIFLGVNPDFNCPTVDGFIPDCGSICSLITASTGVKPEFFGKPSKYTLDYVLKNTGYKDNEIAFVGDRLYTDIAIGKDNNSITILVLSGEAKVKDLEKSEIQPTLVFNNLKEVGEILKSGKL
ncbi:HAD-IIA family hydrolase [Clostridium sp. JN-9]|uniref:HAD-IIA family hydrolase n=1 Tax=Clostridium sp. JN-9 TaxID=2507159 RepID=UPI000FFE1CA8|nr:HAD-IIA family hydrolase [Clostridium sp. JN-9]QAT39151.1 HAD-IIA family hydrolase [Clostridium sp. JN-9]